MGRGTSGGEMDADIELGRGGSRFGAFLGGILLGAILSAAAAVAVSLTSPLPADLPLSGRVEIVGQPPAIEGEASAAAPPNAPGEAPTEGRGDAAPEANAPDPSEPATVAVGPQGSGAAVPESVETAAPEPSTAEPSAPEPATPEPATPEPSTPEPATPEPATPEPGTADAASAGTEPAADAPDPAAASAPAEKTEFAATPETEIAPDARPGASAQPGPAGSALADNARPFDAPGQAPLLAVVLTGDRVAEMTADRLALLTMPLTVAIPPESPRAAELGADARAAGHEVLADLSLAAEARAGGPGQAQASVQRIASLHMAVGATTTGGTADADLLAPVLAELGRHGFAWVDTGAAISTPAERIAREIGMPYTQGNRSVGGDASPEQIYRAIDSAAHQARQWGTSVLFLDASEPALQALVKWGLEQRGDDTVWFAPISAVIERRGAE